MRGQPVATLVNSVNLRLVSGSHWRRVGLIPMVVGIGLGFVFVALWLTVAFFVFQFNPLWSILLSCSTTVFATYLGIIGHRLVSDAFRHYIFELNDSEAVLVVMDRMKKRKCTQMVLLDDIKYAEYYPFQDSASIILHAPYIDMEVPLWPMGSHGQDVVDFLDGRGVHVVNVQSDEPIPD